MIKLKTNKTFNKGLRKKNKNSKNKNQIENIIFEKLRFNDEIENK